jgi:uncharacterized protein
MRVFTRRRFLRLGATAIAVPTAAALAEPYTLDLTRHEVPMPNLPPALDGLRVVHLTDIHRGPLTPDHTILEAVRRTQELQPDLVVLTGDFVHGHHRDAEPLARMLALLTPRLGMWACLGNHDYGSSAEKVTDSLSRLARVRVLRNDALQAAPGLWIAGVEDRLKGFPTIAPFASRVPEQAACLFLVHEPPGIDLIEEKPWVALAGHTHGGQIRVGERALHLPGGMEGFPLYEGWGSFGKASLFVSRGIGNTGFPMRLRCAPELALHTLRSV